MYLLYLLYLFMFNIYTSQLHPNKSLIFSLKCAEI